MQCRGEQCLHWRRVSHFYIDMLETVASSVYSVDFWHQLDRVKVRRQKASYQIRSIKTILVGK